VVKLEQNYRYAGSILDAANAVIAQNKARLGKTLWTAEGKGEPLRIFAAASDEEEARFIVDEVKQLHREGTALADMALLYRSNAQSRILEHALFRAGIAYKVYGGLRFFEARRSSTRSPTCAWPPTRRRHGVLARGQFPAARHRGRGASSSCRDGGLRPRQPRPRGECGAVAGRGGTAIAGFMAIVGAAEDGVRNPHAAELTWRCSRHPLKTLRVRRERPDRVENLTSW